MASTSRMTTKDGRDYYNIRVRMGRQGATLSMRWYVPDGWSQKAIDRELAKVAADFERRCKAGEVLTTFLLDIQAQGQAHSSVVRLYAVLSGFFKAAYLDDTISKNPMDKVQKPTPRKDELKREGPEAYTESELAFILDCLQAEPLKWRALVSLLIETGIRRGECCGVKEGVARLIGGAERDRD